MTTPHVTRPRRRAPAGRLRAAPRQTGLLQRPISLSWLTSEMVAYGLLIAASLLLHLWGLGKMAMHHDESLHAWFSWRFYSGRGDFNCWGDPPVTADTYCYNPVYHGPTLYLLTYASYFLFGVSEATARLPMALAGVALIGSCWWLRPLMGRRAALISAVLLLISPSVLYFTRFARHDALAILWTLWIMIGVFRFMQEGRTRWIYLAAASVALLWATHELVFIVLFVIVTFLIQRLLWEVLPNRIFVILAAAAMLLSGALMIVNPGLSLPANPGQPANIIHFGGIGLIVFMTLLLGQIISLRWSQERLTALLFRPLFDERLIWAKALGVFVAVFALCFTTFFTYPKGFIDGTYAGLAYWMGTQHSFARGDQPWYYYFMQMGVYEILPAFLSLLGLGGWLGRLVWRKAVVSSALWDEDDSTVATESAPVASVALPALNAEATEGGEAAKTDAAITSALAAETLDGEAAPAPSTLAAETLDGELAAEAPAAADSGLAVLAAETLDGERAAQTDAAIASTLAAETSEGETAEAGMPLVVAASAAPVAPAEPAAAPNGTPAETPADLWIGYLFYWFLLSFTVFSWAGEKMPWLVVHMAVPAILGGAWALDRVLDRIDWHAIRSRWGWVTLPLLTLIVVLLMRAQGDFAEAKAFNDPSLQQAQQAVIAGSTSLFWVVACVLGLVAIGFHIGRRQVLAAVTLAFAVLLGAYTVRATANVVYRTPDVPRELLVYTQTSPDVPVIVEQLERIAVTQTRNNRTATDPTGGNSMTILLSSGDSATGNSEGSLRWPLEWYLRDWTNVKWVDKAQIAALGGADLEAPVAIFARSNMATDTDERMKAAGYIEAYDTVFNWWFPEYGSDNQSGYKDRLYDTKYGCDDTLRGQKDPNGRDLWRCSLGGAQILTWPFRSENWSSLRKFMLFRELPEGAQLNGREMVVYIKRSLAPVPSDSTVAGQQGSLIKLIRDVELSGERPVQARGLATGPDGAVYIADAASDRVLVYELSGVTRIISGTGEMALFEPSGVAVDAQGNVYVTDTWHARVVKFDPQGRPVAKWGVGEEELGAGSGKMITRTDGTPEGNAAKPLGFFGPRGIAVDQAGHVFIADTGNKRVVVTDSNGNYIGQVGTPGAAPGQFNEPIGVAVDTNGNLYVGDSWNGRIQVFAVGPDGVPAPAATTLWLVNGWRVNTYLDPFLAVSADGQVAVTVPELNQAALFDPTGKLLLTWGGKGNDDASMDGPSGISPAPGGGFYIAEKTNQRVQLWTTPKVR